MNFAVLEHWTTKVTPQQFAHLYDMDEGALGIEVLVTGKRQCSLGLYIMLWPWLVL